MLLLNCKGGLLLFLLLLIVTPILKCSMFCCVLLCVHSSFAIISGCFALSCWCIIVMWLFLTMRSVCLQFVIVVFPDHTQYFW